MAHHAPIFLVWWWWGLYGYPAPLLGHFTGVATLAVHIYWAYAAAGGLDLSSIYGYLSTDNWHRLWKCGAITHLAVSFDIGQGWQGSVLCAIWPVMFMVMFY